jgi:hypothetical protein
MYAIYPTLLDAFSWYKRSESETALQEFIDKVNRVKTPATDPMLRGIAFNEKVDNTIKGVPIFLEKEHDETVKIHDIGCPVEIIEEFSDLFSKSALQVFVDGRLTTRYGQIKIYGYIDALQGHTIGEFKTTGKYEFPKYLHNWQHPCYLHCLKDQSIRRFVYLITDFKNVYREDYHWTQAGEDSLIGICNELIEFLEEKRDLITDKKVFGL